MYLVDFSQGPAAYSILILFVVLSVIALRGSRELIERNKLVPYRVLRNREYGTIISSGFVHSDYMHLLFNGITMLAFGPVLEAHRLGTVKFVALYFAGLVLTSLGEVWKYRRNPDYASLGASGAIMSVLFAYIVYFPTSTIYYFGLPVPAPLYAFAYMAYCWWASKQAPSGVAHAAHLDGAIVGVLFVAITDFGVWRNAIDRIVN